MPALPVRAAVVLAMLALAGLVWTTVPDLVTGMPLADYLYVNQVVAVVAVLSAADWLWQRLGPAPKH